MEVIKVPNLVEICMENAVCNMKCKYCFGGFVDGHNCHTNKVPEFNPIILDNKLSKLPVDYHGGFKYWGGEPLANWSILKKVIEYTTNKFKWSKGLIITNGSLLDEDKVKFLIERDISVTISHDGYGQHLRGIDPLENDKIIKCIQLLQMNGLFQGFHMVIHSESDDLTKQKEYWAKIQNILGFSFSVTWNLLRVTDDWTKPYAPDIDKAIKFAKYSLEQIVQSQYHMKFKVQLKNSTDADRIIQGIVFKDMPDNGKPCGADNVLTIGLSGNEYLCVQDTERKSGEKSISVADGFKFELSDKCNICKIKRYCNGMCMVMNDEQRALNCDRYIKLTEALIDYIENSDNRLRDAIYSHYIKDNRMHRDCPPPKKLMPKESIESSNEDDNIVDISDVTVLDIINTN